MTTGRTVETRGPRFSQIQVALADDHPIVRQGLRAVLEAEGDITVVGEAADGLGAVEMADKLKPDVMVVDIIMPGLMGLEAVRQICQRSPRTRCVVLSMHANDAYVLEALRNGATGYILKGSDSTEMVHAVRLAARGERYLSPEISAEGVETLLDKAQASRVSDPYDALTTREREVFQLAAEGLTNLAIAERLFISARTVEIHRANVFRKLNLKTQTNLVRYALRRGVLTIE
ncbi:MAG: response regulator transcription factor [Cytophagales bacterium]|nr:response regulator transcription factor [Armatimonadota bacterium]